MLPGASPAGTPRQRGLPVPAWPPADYVVTDTFAELFTDLFGTVVVTTTVPVLPGGSP